MSTPSSKTSLKPADEGVKAVRIGIEYQVDNLPAASGSYECQHDGAAADQAKLIWAPFDRDASTSASLHEDGDDGDRYAVADGMAGQGLSVSDQLVREQATYLRHWAAVELQEIALEELFKAQGDVAVASASMRELQEASNLRRLPQAELTRSAALGAAIIAHRKDFYRAKCSLTASGVAISVGQLQHFFYGQFRSSSENKLLSLAKKAEHQDDGYADYCELCGLGGFLICCDECSAVYHLRCAGLDAVPNDDWLCPRCTSTKGQLPLAHLGSAQASAGAKIPGATALHGAPASTGAGGSAFAAATSSSRSRYATSPTATLAGATASLVPRLPPAEELPGMSVRELQQIARSIQLDTSLALEKSELVQRIEAVRHRVAAGADQAGCTASAPPGVASAFVTGHAALPGDPGIGLRGPPHAVDSNREEPPPQWLCEQRVSVRGRSYKAYRGPGGLRAQSKKEAWRYYDAILAGEVPGASRRKRGRCEKTGASSGHGHAILLPSSPCLPSSPPLPQAAQIAPLAGSVAAPSAAPRNVAPVAQLQPPAWLASAATGSNGPSVRAAPAASAVKLAPERIFRTADGKAYTADGEWC